MMEAKIHLERLIGYRKMWIREEIQIFIANMISNLGFTEQLNKSRTQSQ